MKWYKKVSEVIIIIAFVPFIILAFVIAGPILLILRPFMEAKNKKIFKKSRYCHDVNEKYGENILLEPEYIFYNAECDNPKVKFIRNEQEKFDYFIYDNTVYVFPNKAYHLMRYDNISGEFKYIYYKDEENFKESPVTLFEHVKGCIDPRYSDLPVKMLVERSFICAKDLKDIPLCDKLKIVPSYDRAFEEVDPEVLSIIPENAGELYKMLKKTPDLAGEFEYQNNAQNELINYSCGNLFLEIDVDYISINLKRNGKSNKNLTHYHPEEQDVYKEVYNITKRGNVLVVKTTLGGCSVLYVGKKQNCPYDENSKAFLSKIYYFEMK